MSIIYDALKKVEHSNLKNLDKSKKETKKTKFPYLIFALVVTVGFFIAKVLFDIFGLPLTKDIANNTFKDNLKPRSKSTAPVVINQPVTKGAYLEQVQEKSYPNLLLNGIFYDGQQYYAIINNKILKEGESIEGARLIRILSNRVELEFEGRPISLKISN